MTASCSGGVNSPGIGAMSSMSSISLMPETRTMKNSSRFDEKTERNFNFSSAGVDLSVASSSTRLKNSNWHKSRLSTDQEKKRFGLLLPEGSDCWLICVIYGSYFEHRTSMIVRALRT